jgi:hypothetical protein
MGRLLVVIAVAVVVVIVVVDPFEYSERKSMRVTHPTDIQRAITVAWARVTTTKADREAAWAKYRCAPSGTESARLKAAKSADITYWTECAAVIELMQSDPAIEELNKLLKMYRNAKKKHELEEPWDTDSADEHRMYHEQMQLPDPVVVANTAILTHLGINK